jgi:hypothetical protein
MLILLFFVIPVLSALLGISAIFITLSRPSGMSIVVVPMVTLPWLSLLDMSQAIIAIPFLSLIGFGLSFIRPKRGK